MTCQIDEFTKAIWNLRQFFDRAGVKYIEDVEITIKLQGKTDQYHLEGQLKLDCKELIQRMERTCFSEFKMFGFKIKLEHPTRIR